MGVCRRRPRGRVLVLLALAGLVAALLSGAVPGDLAEGLRTGLLFVGPALVLALALLARRYPGERAIERWRARRAPVRRRSGAVPAPRARLQAVRGAGCLIAVSLAGRAPPLVSGC
jgi:hypothetical protein